MFTFVSEYEDLDHQNIGRIVYVTQVISEKGRAHLFRYLHIFYRMLIGINENHIFTATYILHQTKQSSLVFAYDF